MQVLPQRHSGKTRQAKNLAGPTRDAAPATEPRRGHLPGQGAEALGREDADAGAEVLLVADGLKDEAA